MLKYVLSDVYMEKDRFGKFLIHLRREKKLTQYELAEMIPALAAVARNTNSAAAETLNKQVKP